MAQLGKVKFVQLSLPKTEMEKLSPTERKRYVMLTCILRDLVILQKHLLFVGNQTPHGQVLTSAHGNHIFYFITSLASKIHEAWKFLKHEGILDESKEISDRLLDALDRMKDYFSNPMTIGIFAFIRDKFGFHYDTWDDLDPKIDSAFSDLAQIEMWLPISDSGNDVFTSTNEIVADVILAEMKALGFSGDRKAFVEKLFDLTLEGAKLILDFSRGYLAEGFSVKWQQKGEIEVAVPFSSDVSLPYVVAKSTD